MRPSRSASTWAAEVGLTWPERLAEGATTGRRDGLEQAARQGCAGTRNATLASPARARSQTVVGGRGRDDERQGTGPEGASERERRLVEAPFGASRLEARHMRDQRIEFRPALRRVERGDGARVRRVGAEPVDGLGREGDEAAAAQEGRSLGDAGRHRARGGAWCG